MADGPKIVVGVKVDMSEFEKMLKDLQASYPLIAMAASAGTGNPLAGWVVGTAVLTVLIDYALEKSLDLAIDNAGKLLNDSAKWNEMLKRVDQSKIKYNVGDDFGAHVKQLHDHVERKIEYFEKDPIEEHVKRIVESAKETSVVLPIELVIEHPKYDDVRDLYDQADFDEINKKVQERISEIQFEESQKQQWDDIYKKTMDSMPSKSEGPIQLPPIYREVEEQIEKSNEAIEQNSKNWSHLDGALALVGDASLNLAGDQAYLSDANNGVLASALQLRKEGLDPLSGTTKESGEAVIDLLSSFEDGAVVFGYTKEELLGVGSAAGEAAEKTKDLDKNALKGVTDQAGKAEETLGTLNSTTGDLSAQSKELVGVQENVTQAVADGSAVMDNAGASAEQFGDALEQVESSGGFFDGIKQGFVDFVENVESNSELMADFFADTLSNMSQNFSDFFYNAVTGKFESLADVAKNAFKSILKSFLDLVSAIATRQIVVSIGALFGIGKSAQAAGGKSGSSGQDAVQTAQAGLGLFGSGLGESFRSLGSLMLGEFSGMTGLLGTVQAALPAIGTILAAAAIAIPIISGLLKKTPRLDIEFDEVKNDVEERAAVVAEFLDPEFFMENIGQVSVKRGGVGIGAGGSNQILELIRERIEETIEGIQDIIAKLPTDMFRELNETLLNAEIDIDTVIAGERLLEFDAKGKKIAEKFQAFIEGELPAKFFASIRESFFDPAFRALGVSAEGTQALIDDFMAKMEAAGSREARAEVGAEFIATFGAFVDAFNIVSGNVNDSIGQTIQNEECEYRMAA